MKDEYERLYRELVTQLSVLAVAELLFVLILIGWAVSL